MNQNQFEGKWNQLKGTFRQKWGQITDDEVQQAMGQKDKLVGLLQERYGMQQEKAQQALESWAGRADNPDGLTGIWNAVQGKWTELMGQFKQEYGKTVDDDLVESQGRRDQLAGMIQREYGLSLGDAYEMVDDWAYGAYGRLGAPAGR